MRTLTDNKASERPERRTAIISRELKRFQIDIAALSETRLADEGQLKEEKGGYTFFWKGKPAEEPRIHGVGFAIKNNLVNQLHELPVGISERLMTLRLMLSNSQMATVISAYAPTLDAQQDVKEAFYADLDTILSKVPKEDKLILLGDFNARVGQNHDLWRGTLGREGTGNTNSNGLMLLTKCSEYDLVITNTLFRQKKKFKTSWMHPRSKCWHLIDYIIVRSQDRRDVLITKAMTGADECWTDHRLIRSTMSIRLMRKMRHQKGQPRRRFNVERLGETAYQQQLQAAMSADLPDQYPEDIEKHWDTLSSTIINSCKTILGHKMRKHQDWYDENDTEIQHLINIKRKTFTTWQNDINCNVKREAHAKAKAAVQSRVRVLKNQWWTQKALEIQQLADTGDTRGFFEATRAVYGPSHRCLTPLRSKDGLYLMKDKEAITHRWKEHYEELLNRDTTPDFEALDQLPQLPIFESMAEPPSLSEVRDAIRKMKNNKSPGADGIPAEVLKEGGPVLLEHIHTLLIKIWKKEEIPAQLRDALVISLFKKGDKTECGNYRGISLLSTVGKALARVLANRLAPLSENTLPESQSGFRPNRSTMDMIFVARQLQEKCREQNQPLYMAFIDLTKAFDSVNRQALWQVLAKIGCPDKFIRVLRLLHDNMSATVLTGFGDETEPFRVDTGVKQGCVIAPSLFSIFIASILHLTGNQLPQGVKIVYRAEELLNINRFRAKGQTTTVPITELQYADDNAIVALSEDDLQCSLTAFAKAYKQLGLAINIKKTQILFQPLPDCITPPNIYIENTKLENVDHFPYLGSLLSSKATIDDEIHHRLSCTSAAYSRLKKRVFENRDLQSKTKILVYKAILLPTLLYGSETWTTYSRHLKSLEAFHQRHLRRILRITWEDYRTNTSVLEEAGIPTITAIIAQHQLRWTGHVIRMQDSRLPKQVLYSQLLQGKRAPGGQKKRYKDNIKDNIRKCHIPLNTWETTVRNRPAWRKVVREGAAQYNRDLHSAAEQKRKRKKEITSTNKVPPKPITTPAHPCPHCPKVCGSRIGLFAHLKTHKDQEGGQTYSTTSVRR